VVYTKEEFSYEGEARLTDVTIAGSASEYILGVRKGSVRCGR